jgi:hypothetical protein
MILGKIESFKIVVIIFDVRSPRDFESHAPEDIDNLVDDECQRMGGSSREPAPGKRDVDALFGKSLGFSLLFDCLEPAFQRDLDGSPELVQPLTLSRPLLGRDLPETTQQECKFTAPAEDVDSDLFQLLLRIRLLDTVQNLSLESFQRIVHLNAGSGV